MNFRRGTSPEVIIYRPPSGSAEPAIEYRIGSGVNTNLFDIDRSTGELRFHHVAEVGAYSLTILELLNGEQVGSTTLEIVVEPYLTSLQKISSNSPSLIHEDYQVQLMPDQSGYVLARSSPYGMSGNDLYYFQDAAFSIVDWSGEIETLVVATGDLPKNQRNDVAVAISPDSQTILLVWSEYDATEASRYYVLGQYFGRDGTAKSELFQVSPRDTAWDDYEIEPSAVFVDNTHAAIMWQEGYGDGVLFGNVFNLSGNVTSVDSQDPYDELIDLFGFLDWPRNQIHPGFINDVQSIALDEGFLIVATDPALSFNSQWSSDIVARVVGPNGATVGETFLVN
ncbi:MAG TPA: hypothetical protein DCW52_11880, partial [Gammaproteobacteria bacterium]|nr:hypothetical protein [Gammaproteobacteria bacterium]